MITIQLLAFDLLIKTKNQMAYLRSLLLKPQACRAYLNFIEEINGKCR